MSTKEILKRIQKLVPSTWLYQLQDIHSSLIFRWLLYRGTEPAALSEKSALVFSPHQDDETFGCGGAIALKRECGIPVAVVFLTDGQGSHGSDSPIKHEIVQIRKQEALKALDILGVDASKIHFLDKPDGTLPDLQPGQRSETVEQIVQLIKLYSPEEVYVPHRKDCHKDHEATYELVKEAIAKAGVKVELLQYPIWLFWRAPIFIMLKLQDMAAARCLSITSVQNKKSNAIASYCSQLEGLPSGFVKRFLSPYEIFFKVSQ
ncbi:GlcNAc-PI de-N-acetylase [Scytonema hofmannii PCC 7110]|uniref:GlcNAc-PI de-N-acetylase n=1 Tax=Scytonema hofmannii PCC 7110 TaxID=128403 RepID=A0A139XGT7_9CYAN|nr:PIG-L family deacetylase [Scytonema hofmannii]KYC43873.1 GlcNAc-PI de-N-acetylase [Scytonema hofmannii PCC 7110]